MKRTVVVAGETYELTQNDHKLTVENLEIIPYEGFRATINKQAALVTGDAQKFTWRECGLTFLGANFEGRLPVVNVEVKPSGKTYELFGFTYDLNLYSILWFAVLKPNRFF